MNIRLLTNVSFAASQYDAGTVLECETEDGEGLVAMGLAEVVAEAPAPVESSMLADAKERMRIDRSIPSSVLRYQ